MFAAWAREEMQNAELEDRRLNKRLIQVLSDLGERPNASIPVACGGYAEMAAAYRFFANDKVTWQGILRPHYERSRQRAAAHRVVLLVQDTSELDLSRPQQQVRGAGPLDNGPRRGAFLHPLQAFTTDGTPLGAVWTEMWTRAEDDASAAEKKEWRRQAPIEEKESYRWLEGLRQARAVAQELPDTTCICIADSEADVYELFAEPRGERPVQWLIRAGYPDRGAVADDGTVRHLREQALAAAVLFIKEVNVRSRQAKVSCDKRTRRQPREGRTARVAVRATTLTLQPPRRPDGALPPVTVNVVLVTEVDPPAGAEPVEWLLLTTLPIDNADQVQEVLSYYATRFLIEIYFRVLKSGCRVEERLFEDVDRLLPCLAVYVVVAWRTLLLCRLGRSCPDLDCEAVFDPAEWRSVWAVVKRTEPPKQRPRLADLLRLVARLGGYIDRPGRKDPPGPQTLWLGLQRMHDLALAWNTFGPGASKRRGQKDV